MKPNKHLSDPLAIVYDKWHVSSKYLGLLQEILTHHVGEFCDATGMKINIDKSKIVVFRNGGHLNLHENWYYKGEHIDVAPFYQYLGAYFTSKLSWTKTKLNLSMQAGKAINYILRCQKHFEAFKLFDTMCKSIVM